MKPIRFLVSLVTTNSVAKFISLLLAVAVWFMVDAEITDKTEQDVPVEVVLVNKKNWEIIRRDVLRVKVVLEGPKSDVARVGDLVIRDRLSGLVRIEETELADQGRLELVHSVKLNPSSFNLQPLNLTVESIHPSSIQVTVVRMGEKELKVNPIIVGVPEKGYVLDKVKVTPSKVAVHGPRVALDKIEEIDTEQVFLFGRDESFEEPVGVSGLIEGYPVSAQRQVTVQVSIAREPGRKVVDRVPVRIIFPRNWAHDRFKAEIDERLDVNAVGPADVVATVTAEDLLLTAELDTSAYERWMNEESDTQHAMAKVRCSVQGPSDEARSSVSASPPNPEIRFKVIRIKGK